MISPDEYSLIIKRWSENKTELLLSASMLDFSAFSKCRVTDVNGDKITLRSVNTDNPAIFAFSIGNPLLLLNYAEPREIPDAVVLASIPEDKRLKSALTLSIPVGAVNPSLSDSQYTVGRIILTEPLS